MTKQVTGRDKKKDCTKRNILYELKCLTCEEEMIKNKKMKIKEKK